MYPPFYLTNWRYFKRIFFVFGRCPRSRNRRGTATSSRRGLASCTTCPSTWGSTSRTGWTGARLGRTSRCGALRSVEIRSLREKKKTEIIHTRAYCLKKITELIYTRTYCIVTQQGIRLLHSTHLFVYTLWYRVEMFRTQIKTHYRSDPECKNLVYFNIPFKWSLYCGSDQSTCCLSYICMTHRTSSGPLV